MYPLREELNTCKGELNYFRAEELRPVNLEDFGKYTMHDAPPCSTTISSHLSYMKEQRFFANHFLLHHASFFALLPLLHPRLFYMLLYFSVVICYIFF
jgi:hypothetical protein